MSESDDDWFEKALREAEDADADDDADQTAVDASTEETSDDSTTESPGTDTSDSPGTDTSDSLDADASDTPEPTDDPFDGTQNEGASGSDGDDPFGGTRDGDAETDTDDDPFGGRQESDTATGDSDPFGGVQSGDQTNGASSDDAFGGMRNEGKTGTDADAGSTDPFGGVQDEESADGAEVGDDDPFGGVQREAGGTDTDVSTGDSDPFGGVQGGDDGDNPFDEDFGSAMGGGSEEFDEEEFDSEIDRLDMGVEGLDEMILGGVPMRSLITVIGSAGTGKTTFGLQFLHEALSNGQNAVYITLEETEESIISSAEEKGWPFSEYVASDQLVVVSMDPIEMANSLDSIRGDLTRLINDFDADRLVLDSVSLLEMMYDDPATRRSEVFDFARSLKRAGVTTMLTSEANADNPFQSRHGLVEYLVDAVFILRYVRPSDFQETRLAVEIQKIRDANHSRETKPYDITDHGIDVYRQANIF